MNQCFVKTDHQRNRWYEENSKKIDAEILKLKLARPALRALVDASIFSVEDLRSKSLDELSALHGIGNTALQKLKTLY